MSFKPSEITREHVLKGIEELKKSTKKLTNGTRWEVFIDDVPYPPKEVMRFARVQYDGSKDWPKGGGWPTNEFLEKMGFEVREKNNNPILTLIANYKKHIQKTHLQDEKYKWELLSHYKGRPNLEAKDFQEEVKGIKYNNLIYPMALAVLNTIIKVDAETIRSFFTDLFNESVDLSSRVSAFSDATLKVYLDNGGQRQHHQDERSIATYLTVYNPEKYTFYKYSFYKRLCELLNEKEAKKNEKYPHYLELLNKIIEEYIQDDIELIDLVKSYVPEYDGSNHLLLAQDILYQMLDKQENVNKVNVKEAFVDWMVANVSGGNYFEKQFRSNRTLFEKEINDYEVKYKENFNSELFIFTTTDYKNEIELIRTNLYNTSTLFSEYSNNHAAGRPKAMLGKKNYLRFLEEHFGTLHSINYWIFQGSPKIYNTVDAINANAVKTWTVSRHRDKIKNGDKFILWLTGDNAGCYALGRVDSEVMLMKEDDAEMSYYLTETEQEEFHRVKIVIEHNFTSNPILWTMVKNDDVFSDFKGSNQGTNFTATKEQYESFLELANVDNSNYEAIKKVLDVDKVALFLSILRKFVTDHSLNPNDDRISFNIRKSKNRLVFIIANKYSFSIEKKNSTTIISALSREKISDESSEYINYKGDVEAYWNKNIDVTNFRFKIEEELFYELNKNSKSPFRKFTNQDFINDVYHNQKGMGNNANTTTPLNQILYGPPGTGKTFKLQQIIENWDLKEKIGSTKDYTAFVKDHTWWKIVALALFELGKVRVPDLAKHPLIIAKLGSSSVKSLKTRLWSSLQHHCVDDCENVKLVKRIGEKVFYKEANSDWRLDDVEAFKSEYDALVEAYSDFKSSDNTKSKDYTFTTCHQSLSYEDFIEGIKPELNKADEDELNEKGIVYEIRKGIFYNACEKAAQKAGFINLKDCLDATKEQRKEIFDQAISENKIHVIFLDEINRCNVSSVFGELITLIEDDKRLGKENEIADITLPYSQDEFGVPANLFIIGTMNTADRSVEALDTALRRRFSFVEMPPDSKVVEEKALTDFPRKEIMEKINNRIELLLDRNHTLGHAYFIKQDFQNSFENEIIPLLQEYFYNDYGKIGLVLGTGFVQVKSISANTDKSVFADFETKNEVDIVKSYELIPFIDVDFKTAITTLLA